MNHFFLQIPVLRANSFAHGSGWRTAVHIHERGLFWYSKYIQPMAVVFEPLNVFPPPSTPHGCIAVTEPRRNIPTYRLLRLQWHSVLNTTLQPTPRLDGFYRFQTTKKTRCLSRKLNLAPLAAKVAISTLVEYNPSERRLPSMPRRSL